MVCIFNVPMQVVGLGNLARRDPEAHVTASSEQYSAPFSDILRFCISSLTFIIVAMIMVRSSLRNGVEIFCFLKVVIIVIYNNTN